MLDFSIGSLFDDEEKYVLNKVAIDISKDECCEQLLFGSEATENEDCSNVLLAVCAKIRDLTIEEWDSLQKYLPFELSFIDGDFEFDNAVFEDEGVIV